MLYILYGQDNYSLHQELGKIKEGIGSDPAVGTNIIRIEGDKASLSDLKIACETIPFLADKRLVIVNGLLERFETKLKTTIAQKSTGKKDQSKDWEQMIACLTNLPDTTILVLVDNNITPRNPLLKKIAGKAQIKIFPLLKRSELLDWVQRQALKTGGKISKPAVEILAKLVGNDLWTMAGEIEKLTLYADGRVIEEQDVKAIVSHAQESNVFAMVDAILENRAGLAEDLLQQLMDKGATPTYLLWMLHRQVRLIVLVKEMLSQRKSKPEIQSKLGLSDYPLQKTIEQSVKYSLTRLQHFYEILLETDIAIKTGKYDGELALNILVVELCGSSIPTA